MKIGPLQAKKAKYSRIKSKSNHQANGTSSKYLATEASLQMSNKRRSGLQLNRAKASSLVPGLKFNQQTKINRIQDILHS